MGGRQPPRPRRAHRRAARVQPLLATQGQRQSNLPIQFPQKLDPINNNADFMPWISYNPKVDFTPWIRTCRALFSRTCGFVGDGDPILPT